LDSNRSENDTVWTRNELSKDSPNSTLYGALKLYFWEPEQTCRWHFVVTCWKYGFLLFHNFFRAVGFSDGLWPCRYLHEGGEWKSNKFLHFVSTWMWNGKILSQDFNRNRYFDEKSNKPCVCLSELKPSLKRYFSDEKRSSLITS
jgi:hypothetical protein